MESDARVPPVTARDASVGGDGRAASVRGGIALFLVALCGFATFDAFCKQMLATYSSPFMNLMRYIATSTIAILWLAREARHGVPWRLWRTPHRGLLLARSVALACVATAFMTALTIMPLAEATAIYFTSPLIMVALSPWLLGERVGYMQWTAVVAGFAGMLLIVRPGGDLPWAGVVLMATAAVSYAFFQLLTRRLSGLVAAPVQYAYMAVVCLVITGAPAAFALPAEWPGWPQLLLLLAGGTCSGVAQLLLLAAFRRAQASILAPLNYIQLLLAVLISAFWFGRPPDTVALAGIALIMGSGAWLALRRTRPLAGDAGKRLAPGEHTALPRHDAPAGAPSNSESAFPR
ncbi:EamA family transporter [Bordetella genomosp. 8]|uniref:EamA family transporter n=1 Tax=Bordetella genomosp. 8 TaxID=1416806 RepID=A0A1W6YFW2_9BORD|nr:DMT family transporter [Bordetella genomosp. 8]ARP79918.1 EamA family transporter [Bordetella genomosp. 8]